MKLRVTKLTKRITKTRTRVMRGSAELDNIKYRVLPKLIPNFYIWFNGYFAPKGRSENDPLFFGIAYTQTRRGNEDVKIVTLSRDGILQIKNSLEHPTENPYSPEALERKRR